MTQFTTTVTAMYTLQTPDPDYVVNVLYQVTGVDGTYTASIGGNTQFNSADQGNAVFAGLTGGFAMLSSCPCTHCCALVMADSGIQPMTIASVRLE